jgi:hypothetical protein
MLRGRKGEEQSRAAPSREEVYIGAGRDGDTVAAPNSGRATTVSAQCVLPIRAHKSTAANEIRSCDQIGSEKRRRTDLLRPNGGHCLVPAPSDFRVVVF